MRTTMLGETKSVYVSYQIKPCVLTALWSLRHWKLLWLKKSRIVAWPNDEPKWLTTSLWGHLVSSLDLPKWPDSGFSLDSLRCIFTQQNRPSIDNKQILIEHLWCILNEFTIHVWCILNGVFSCLFSLVWYNPCHMVCLVALVGCAKARKTSTSSSITVQWAAPADNGCPMTGWPTGRALVDPGSREPK